MIRYLVTSLTLNLVLLGLYQREKHKIPLISIQTHKTIASVDEEYLSIAIDTAQIVGSYFWDKEGKMTGGRGKNKIPPLDLTQATLIKRAQLLQPAYLRIGGSEADAVFYNINDQVRPASFDSEFTPERLDELHQFSKNTGLKILFTLNQGPSSWKDNKWDHSNLVELLGYLKKIEADWRFELGNEVFAYWAIFGLDYQQSEKEYAQNYRKTKNLLKLNDLNSRLAGPASAYWPVIGEPLAFLFGSMEHLIPQLGTDLDVITWHYYPTQSFRCPLAIERTDAADLISAKKLDRVGKWANQLAQLKNQYAPKAKLWLGETGSAQCGGEPGVSDQYINALWWIDQLGQLATYQHQVVIRQNLIGADYALLNPDGSPRADYHASVLWKKHMGRNVLKVNYDNRNQELRFYSHCSKFGDGLVLLAINLAGESKSFELDGFAGEKYLDSLAPRDGLYSQKVRLNGRDLIEPEDIFTIPSTKTTENRIEVDPFGVLFVKIKGRFAGC